MLLRRLNEHVRDQNWFAVFIDFFIVVVGVFIGLQVANWNDERVAFDRETQLLLELKKEVEVSIFVTDQKMSAYKQVAEAGKRSLRFLSDKKGCGSDCWEIIVTFMHASQWQNVGVQRSTYDSMRDIGLPRDPRLVSAMEKLLANNDSAVSVYKVQPRYRTILRQLIPVELQEYYWAACWLVEGGLETYVLDCPSEVSDEIANQTVQAIVENPEIKPLLTFWIGQIMNIPVSFADQNTNAREALSMIEEELNRRAK